MRVLVILAAVAFLLLPGIASTDGPPSCYFAGTVKLDGADVADGTTITATIAGSAALRSSKMRSPHREQLLFGSLAPQTPPCRAGLAKTSAITKLTNPPNFWVQHAKTDKKGERGFVDSRFYLDNTPQLW